MSAGPLADLPLIDAHCHTVVAAELDRDEFELLCSEADRPAPAGASYLDSHLGLAIRRWCAPLLELPTGAPDWAYVSRRAELGWREVTGRLLRAAGLVEMVVDTGTRSSEQVAPAALAEAAGARVHAVVALEHLAEQVVRAGVEAGGFADAYTAALRDAARLAVAVKSVVAYRHGLDLPGSRPTSGDVREAAGAWLSGYERTGSLRLTDPVLLRYILWAGVETGLPLQLHTGFGDRDLTLPLANPALLQAFCTAVEPTGVPIVLLHCYPYHREASWLASVYPNVYLDVGLTMAYLGARAHTVLAEFCELAPFGKLLFSTNAYGVAELYQVGAAQFRHSFGRLLDAWLHDGAINGLDADRIAIQVGGDNARMVYRL